MENVTLDTLIEHITRRVGLRARANERSEWSQALTARMIVCGLTQPSDYLQLLTSRAVDSEGEWRWLLPLLTNGESYFLRDQGQFALLRHRIFPELMKRRKAQRSLRCWSAGCSTGEEPYSLALLMQEVVPPDWNVLILGTDINQEALQKARQGIYGTWSFRALSHELRERCFHPVAEGYQLNQHVRQMVRFERDNLSGDASSQSDITRDMDLILCRNVLIYFNHEAVKRTVRRFAGALREGGYLLAGHAELHRQDVAPLHVRVFPESTVYERQADQLPVSAQTAGRRTTVSAPARRPAKHGRIRLSKPATASSRSQSTPQAAPPQRLETEKTATLSVEPLGREARLHADAGRYAEAVRCCQQAIALDPVASEPYLVWAQVALEQEELETAKRLFKKVIYLASTQVEAYLGLATVYEQAGDLARARRARLAALELQEVSEAASAPVSRSMALSGHESFNK